MKSQAAKKLKELREKHKLTQLELATKLGVAMLTVNNLENDKRRINSKMAVRLEQVEQFELSAKDWMDLVVDEEIVWARTELEESSAA
jgi:transcriptional regulator with XRE-family HTH domain